MFQQLVPVRGKGSILSMAREASVPNSFVCLCKRANLTNASFNRDLWTLPDVKLSSRLTLLFDSSASSSNRINLESCCEERRLEVRLEEIRFKNCIESKKESVGKTWLGRLPIAASILCSAYYFREENVSRVWWQGWFEFFSTRLLPRPIEYSINKSAFNRKSGGSHPIAHCHAMAARYLNNIHFIKFQWRLYYAGWEARYLFSPFPSLTIFIPCFIEELAVVAFDD